MAFAVAGVNAEGNVYVCKDKDGNTQFLSEPQGDCTTSSTNAPAASNKPSAKNKPAPRAVTKEQRQRDKKRGEILLYELQQEQKFFRHYKNLLASASGDNRELLTRRAHRHRQNILALRQELARLGLNAGNTGD